MKNILISNPGVKKLGKTVYLPLIYPILKNACKENKILYDQLNWLDPIYYILDTIEINKSIDLKTLDVLALSTYIWNWNFNYNLAKLVKEVNPNCLIIAGGPQVEWQKETYFNDYPFIDIVVKGDGETPFRKILEKVVVGETDFENCESCLVRENIDNRYFVKLHKEDISTSLSPFLDDNCLENLIIKAKDKGFKNILTFWETNRGCPFGCTFCDWGSSTLSKIRKRSRDQILNEPEWFGRNKIAQIFIADANFGMLHDDIETVHALVAARKKFDYPINAQWNSGKNAVNKVLDVNKLLYEGGLSGFSIPIGIQSTNINTLKNMNRSNISVEKYKILISEHLKNKIPVTAQLIVPNPGDTYDTVEQSIIDCIEMGFHEEIKMLMFEWLPNAPASSIAYQQKYGLKTTKKLFERSYESGSGIVNLDTTLDSASVNYFYFETDTFSKDDWIEIYRYGPCVLSLHNYALLRFIAMFLHTSGKVQYGDFYKTIYETLKKEYVDIFDNIKRINAGFVNELSSIITFRIDDIDIDFDVEEYLYMNFILDYDNFIQHIKNTCVKNNWMDDVLRDCFIYQENIINRPFSEYEKTWINEYNWYEYFNEIMSDNKNIILEKNKLKFISDCRTIGVYNNTITNLDSLKDYYDTVIKRKHFRHYTNYSSNIKMEKL